MVLSLLLRSFLVGVCTLSLDVFARPAIIDIPAGDHSGAEIGALIGEQTLKIFPHVQQQYDAYLAFLLQPAQFQQLAPQIFSLKAAVDPDYLDEVDAIAAVWQLGHADLLGDGKLSVNEFWLLQLLPDLTDINKGVAFAAANSDDKNPIAARNVDWRSTPDLRSLQTLTVYRYEDRSFVTVGFAGFAGVINGYNDRGLFASLLDASDQHLSRPVSAAQRSSVFELRTTLRQEDKIGPASQTLAEKAFPRSVQILLADRDNVAVLEKPDGKAGQLRKTGSTIINEMPWDRDEQLAAVNCLVLKTSPSNCYASTDHYRWSRIGQLLPASHTQSLSVDEVIALMQDQANTRQALFNLNTLQSMVFTPKDSTLYLYTQAVESAEKPDPVVEKYRFFTARTGFGERLFDLTLLALGIGILGFGWIYVFGGDKKKFWTFK